jgi:hypothetical protein
MRQSVIIQRRLGVSVCAVKVAAVYSAYSQQLCSSMCWDGTYNKMWSIFLAEKSKPTFQCKRNVQVA